jgi:hypothetical protein
MKDTPSRVTLRRLFPGWAPAFVTRRLEARLTHRFALTGATGLAKTA